MSVNAVMAQTFPPGVTNQNTDVSRREIQLFDPQVYDGSLRKHLQPRTPSASKLNVCKIISGPFKPDGLLSRT